MPDDDISVVETDSSKGHPILPDVDVSLIKEELALRLDKFTSFKKELEDLSKKYLPKGFDENLVLEDSEIKSLGVSVEYTKAKCTSNASKLSVAIIAESFEGLQESKTAGEFMPFFLNAFHFVDNTIKSLQGSLGTNTDKSDKKSKSSKQTEALIRAYEKKAKEEKNKLAESAIEIINELEKTLSMRGFSDSTMMPATRILDIIGKAEELAKSFGAFSENNFGAFSENNLKVSPAYILFKNSIAKLKEDLKKILIEKELTFFHNAKMTADVKETVSFVKAEDKPLLKEILQEVLSTVEGYVLIEVLSEEELKEYNKAKADDEFAKIPKDFEERKHEIDKDHLSFVSESLYKQLFDIVGYEGRIDSIDSPEFKKCMSRLPEDIVQMVVTLRADLKYIDDRLLEALNPEVAVKLKNAENFMSFFEEQQALLGSPFNDASRKVAEDQLIPVLAEKNDILASYAKRRAFNKLGDATKIERFNKYFSVIAQGLDIDGDVDPVLIKNYEEAKLLFAEAVKFQGKIPSPEFVKYVSSLPEEKFNPSLLHIARSVYNIEQALYPKSKVRTQRNIQDVNLVAGSASSGEESRPVVTVAQIHAHLEEQRRKKMPDEDYKRLNAFLNSDASKLTPEERQEFDDLTAKWLVTPEEMEKDDSSHTDSSSLSIAPPPPPAPAATPVETPKQSVHEGRGPSSKLQLDHQYDPHKDPELDQNKVNIYDQLRLNPEKPYQTICKAAGRRVSPHRDAERRPQVTQVINGAAQGVAVA